MRIRVAIAVLTITLAACGGSDGGTTAGQQGQQATTSTEAGDTGADAAEWLDEVHAPTIDRIAQVNRRLTDRLEQASDDEVDKITSAFCSEMRGTIKHAQGEPAPPSADAADRWSGALDGFLEAHAGEDCFWQLEHRTDELAQAMIDLMAVEDLLPG